MSPNATATIDAVVAGHLCLDITPSFPEEAGHRSLGEILRPGTLTAVGAATLSTGGPVSNTALPMLRLGLNTKLMGKVGDDGFGAIVLDILRRESPGADTEMAVVPGEHTSYSVVIAPPGTDRIFLHFTGSNDTFGYDDVDFSVVGRSRLFHLGYPPLLPRTFANGGEELVRIYRAAKEAGATTSLDLVYTDPASPAGRVDWRGVLARVLPFVDVFPPSVEELLFMLRRDAFDDLSRRAGDRELLTQIGGGLLRELGEMALSMGAGVVLIKCGQQGLYLRTADRGRLEAFGRGRCGDVGAWANRERFLPAYVAPRVVSGTGAGDCAIAGFLAALLRGCGPEQSVRIAAAVGAQNVTAADAVSGVRPWDETLRQVASNPTRHEVTMTLEGFRRDAQTGEYVGPADAGA